MISQFFILSTRGDTIITRDCKQSSAHLDTKSKSNFSPRQPREKDLLNILPKS